tara:strand:+ start:3977 stop:4585 length:609 start_codon:yes stop_codon:yes gene_type:complete
MSQKIGILDLRISNICSLKNAVKFLGYKFETVKEDGEINKYHKLIIPGVGTFPESIKMLKENKLDLKLKHFLKKKKILGICLGMQIFSKESCEIKKTKGLNIYQDPIKKLKFIKKLPNLGFKKVKIINNKNNFRNIKNFSEFYFMHSFGVTKIKSEFIESVLEINQKKIISSIKVNNFYGAQFHPEKSRENGLKFLNNFLYE